MATTNTPSAPQDHPRAQNGVGHRMGQNAIAQALRANHPPVVKNARARPTSQYGPCSEANISAVIQNDHGVDASRNLAGIRVNRPSRRPPTQNSSSTIDSGQAARRTRNVSTKGSFPQRAGEGALHGPRHGVSKKPILPVVRNSKSGATHMTNTATPSASVAAAAAAAVRSPAARKNKYRGQHHNA